MAIEIFYSVEENGLDGARAKAKMLEERYGYRILNIEHCPIYQWGALSTPYAANYGKKEMGYKITVDNRSMGYEPIIPELQ